MTMKPKVAFFDFSCCEGCQLQIANLEEDIIAVVDLVDIVEFREVITGKAPKYDIAFVEGSITRKEDENRLEDIRSRSELLVAFGSCAATGGINRLKDLRGDLEQVRRDVYGDDWNRPHLETYMTKAVDEVVRVDHYLYGCPISRDEFLGLLEALALGIKPEVPDYPVCAECKIMENVCMFHMGKTCMGPIVRAGCGAACPTNNLPCEGCRGAIPHANRDAMHQVLSEHDLTVDEIMNKFSLFAIGSGVA
jgi:coenzyme F420-reducing hydrogenase gamma subunit